MFLTVLFDGLIALVWTFVKALSSLYCRPGFPLFIFIFIDPACGNCFKAWIKSAPLSCNAFKPWGWSHISHGQNQLIKAPPFIFLFFLPSLFFLHFFFVHIPASFAIIPRPLPVFFPSLFFVPVTPFPHHSYCPPATPLILPSWENRKRGQGSAVAPQDAVATSFSLDLIWGFHSLAIASFPSSLATYCFSAHVPGKI